MMDEERKNPWSYEETGALLQIWAQGRVQQMFLEAGVRNVHVWKKVTKELATAGFPNRSIKQVREKIKRLKEKYKVAKTHNNKSGNGRPAFQFYGIIDHVLGDGPPITPPLLLQSGDTDNVIAHLEVEHNYVEEEDNTHNDAELVACRFDSSCEVSLIEDSVELDASTPSCSSTDVTPSRSLEPATKKKKVSQPKLLAALTMVMEQFRTFQEQSEERFFKYEMARKAEEDRQRKEDQLREDSRRQEEREHELRVLRLLTRQE